MKKFLSAAITAGALVLGSFSTTVLAAYPERPITLIVPWGAGGGTDATGRMIGSLLEKELGQPVNVVNRTGGSGVVGHSAIANAKPDGYTIGVATVEIGMMHSDSEWNTVKDAVDAIKANPGAHKSSGTGQGGIWHLAMAGMLNTGGISPDASPWVPSKGAAPGLQELAAGGVDIVTCSIVEAGALIEAGKVKSLAVMDTERNGAFPDVPTLKEAAGLDWQMAAWRGLAGPKGMPDEATETLTAAFEKVGDEFSEWMASSDEALGSVMKAVGLAK